jgi:hypothetical protein
MTKTLLDSNADFKKLCKTVAQLTDNNQHTFARIEIAKYYAFKGFVTRLELIEQYHKVDGHLCGELAQLRSRLSNELMAAVKLHGSQEQYNLISQSL